MNPKWQNIAKDYLTFSKKERNGIYIIFFLSIITILISRYYPVAKPITDTSAFQQDLAKLQISIDTSHKTNTYYRKAPSYMNGLAKGNDHSERSELFQFDPNTLSNEGWRRLGVSERTANTIHNFLAKGYRFKEANDIRKIYGMNSTLADRLIPFVRITSTRQSGYYNITLPLNNNDRKTESVKYIPKLIDINEADTSQFISLPGIGSKLATRIINFRQKLGGFYDINQVAETYGIPDSTFQMIKGRLACNKSAIKTININTADANELKMHPYLKWSIANAIVNYRNQHGSYRSADDLRKIEILTDDIIFKIAPYLMY